MKKIDKLIYKFTFCFLLSISSIHNSQAQFKVIGYVPNWIDMGAFANSFDFSKVTHINVAFKNPVANGDLTKGSNTGLATLVSKAHASNVKVLISLGGGTDSENSAQRQIWFNLINSQANADLFAAKALSYVNTWNLDGIDVDLEGPAINSNYTFLIKGLSDVLKPTGKLLTAALKHDYGGNNVPNAALPYFDFVNVMAYDETGSWSANAGQHSSMSYAQYSLNYWVGRGMAKSKLILGVPFYGYAWNTAATTAGNWPYINIVNNFVGAENTDQAGNIIYYNGIPTIKSKTSYAIENSYGGIMIWELSNDATGAKSLLKAINEVVLNTFPNDLPLVALENPASNTTIIVKDIELKATASDNDGSILRVEFYNGTTKLGEDINAPYTFSWSNIVNGVYNITAKATDDRGATSTSTSITLTVNAPLIRIPYNNIASIIPGKIEAENYDNGGTGFTFYDLSATNEGAGYRSDAVDIETCTEGGFNLAYTKASEWTEYSVKVTTGSAFKIESRVAATATGGKFHIELDEVNVSGSIDVPNTAGWQKWQTVTTTTNFIAAGDKIMRLVFETGDFNINYINFAIVNGVEKDLEQLGITFGPNPSQNEITITTNSPTQIELLTIEGKQISSYSSTSNSINLNTNNLLPGVYLLKFATNTGQSVQKIIIE